MKYLQYILSKFRQLEYKVINTHGVLMTVDDFKSHVHYGHMNSYSGFALPAIDNFQCVDYVLTSKDVKYIPDCATHIVWYGNSVE